jgi:hypothetical protein
MVPKDSSIPADSPDVQELQRLVAEDRAESAPSQTLREDRQ